MMFSATRRCFSGARKAMRFVLSGEDDTLGGGIYWRENRCEIKSSTTNAVSASAALRLYQKTGEASYLSAGRRLIEWATGALQTPDGLFIDHIHVEDGISNKRWLHNSAAMARACLILNEAAGDEMGAGPGRGRF